MIAPVVDATAPGVAHSPARVTAHAYPESSRVALCGHVRPEHARPGKGKRCPLCCDLAGKRHWIGRG